jgi:hypothetical protein
MSTPKITIRFCNPWESFIADLMANSERACEEYELEQDLKTETDLAVQHAYGELDCPWPWYADAPIEVQEPEVFSGWAEIGH